MKQLLSQQVSKIRVLPYVMLTLAILSIPLIAMQFTDQVRWGVFDFVVIGILLMGAGLAYEFIALQLQTRKQRSVAAVVMVLVVLYLWAELAVGIFTTLGN